MLGANAMVLTRAMTIALLALGTLGGAVGWRDCFMDPSDRWLPARPNSLPAMLHDQYQQRYTCQNERGAWEAAGYRFDSKCTARAFTIPEIQSCLKGRRVVFLGDSLAVQQGDSMVGMLGWNADFLKLGDPRNAKWTYLPDGSRVPGLYECWRQPVDKASRCERCYDVFGRDVPPDEKESAEGRAVAEASEPHGGLRDGGHRLTAIPHLAGHVGINSTAGDGQVEISEKGVVEEREGAEETSVHLRMYTKPAGHGWLEKVIADFNETRASDVFVINFGAHFPETTEGEGDFKRETQIMLDDMATLGEAATVIWREMSPTHFPAANGSYEIFRNLPTSPDNNCCIGTPPPVSERNVWVQNYLNDNGLADRVKLLQIYQMSTLRGSAHRSCHIAPPTTPENESLAETRLECTSSNKQTLDCRHWSETGVVEEWNKLMLNHICPA